MIEIRFHGRGGQGGLTAARILASAFWKENKYSLVLPEFRSERRSAPIAIFLRVDEKPIVLRSKVYTPDYLVILDPSLLRLKQVRVMEGFRKERGLIIINAVSGLKYLKWLAGRRIGIIDVDAIASKYGLGPRALPATGAAILGAFAKITGLLKLESIIAAVEESTELPRKDDNIKAIKESFEKALMAEIPMAENSLNAGNESPASSLKKLPESTISLGDTEVNLTGSWRKIKPYYEDKIPPCQDACPLGNDIAHWISFLRQGKIREAWERLMEKNPLPAVTGRVCQAFCENGCNRKEFDEALSIKELEKFLGDTALAKGWQPKVLGERVRPFSIAVVGSGPAGLSCAYQLARKRYSVRIWEQLPVLGGQLRFGIPGFRLPKDVLDKEIGNIVSLGVGIFEDSIFDQERFERLLLNHDAFFFATGLQKSKKLNIPGEENPDVLYGLEFLKKVNLGNELSLGKKVIVIGGGNTAIDAARTVRRLGSQAVIFYRRTKSEMPAIEEEIILARSEGVEIRELVLPVGIFHKAAEFKRAALGKPDETGRRKPVPIDGSNFREEFDNLIIAVGEEAENSFFDNLEDERFFFGGDLSTKAGTVAAAIGSGRKAAKDIDHYLQTGQRTEEERTQKIVQFSDLNLAYFKHQKRKTLPRLEAKRCFSCGVCDLCGNCWKFCPHMAISEKDKEMKINYDYCKGCLICSQECPRSVISQELEV